MEDRRRFIKHLLGAFSAVTLMEGLIPSAFGRLFAQMKKTLLPKGTQRSSLVNRNPSLLDARYLELTPLPEFGVMGLSDHAVDLQSWSLKISGNGMEPMDFSYSKILSMPSIERKVLMICPGVFANIGLWKGVSFTALFEAAGYGGDAGFLTVSGPEGPYPKVKRFPMEDIRAGRVFLSYQANGKPLFKKHGFPLRAVAEGYYGHDWVKYVDRIALHQA